MSEKSFKFEINLKNLSLGIVSGIIIFLGLYLYILVINGRLNFENSPAPRHERGLYIIVSWILICLPALILAPNKSGIILAIALAVGLYLSFAVTVGTFMIFDASSFIDISIAIKILIIPIIFIIIIIVLLYNAVAGQEFFRSVIFSGTLLGFGALGWYTGMLM
ncbi:MAG: hypothetical protein ACFE8A_13515 [Candidatus Hodarchaeota archaeon]